MLLLPVSLLRDLTAAIKKKHPGWILVVFSLTWSCSGPRPGVAAAAAAAAMVVGMSWRG